jgi:uncharacterized protein
MGKDYQLYISFPESYSASDTITRYPVLYVMDGRQGFPVFDSGRELREPAKELEDVIIVGIGSGLDEISWLVNRDYDFTPSKDTTYEKSIQKYYGLPEGSVQTGGAEKFLQCITEEIIPFVDKHYNTNGDRGITGFSLGGLFTAYCLLNSEGVFTRYSIGSPSLWWNSGELLSSAESFLSKNNPWQKQNTIIFISVGALEGDMMVPPMVKFSSLLESKACPNVTLISHVFDDETHDSVIPAFGSRTLSVLYKKKSLPR